ncbi:ribonuclease H-like domain-containing protein [Tanacetum coccineum]
MTRQVLLRCDSMRDLYPITYPFPIPRALLVSQHTWHQCLGHLGGDVLRRIVSNNVISCNKEKPPVLCHAWQTGADVDETFSPVVKPSTIRNVLSLAGSRHWPIHQLDCKNAFLHSDLSETVYMHQPPEFRDLYSLILICLQQIMYFLHKVSGYEDWDSLNYILGIFVTRDSSGIFLSQKKYVVEILERAHMVNCNPSRTPVAIESKLGIDGDLVSDPTLYRSLAGSLQYLTFSRPDISYTVQHTGWLPYYSAIDFRLLCLLGNNLLSWFFKRQPTLSRSSAEAEYRGVANAVAETCWLRNLLRELHTLLSSATLVYCDNVSVVYLSSNPVQHQCAKYIEIDIHFVRDLVVGAASQVRVLIVLHDISFADISPKVCISHSVREFRSSFERSVSSRSNCGGLAD